MHLYDKDEVKKAEIKERDRRKQEINDIRTVCSTASGIRLLWRLMTRAGSFNSNFDPESHASMSYLCGKQDFGRFIMSEVIEADPNLYIKMMKLNSKELTNGPESTTD